MELLHAAAACWFAGFTNCRAPLFSLAHPQQTLRPNPRGAPKNHARPCNSAKRSVWSRGGAEGDALGRLLHVLLEHGSGLRIGPDCDGLLNFCDWDELAAAMAAGGGGGDGGAAGAAGPSAGALAAAVAAAAAAAGPSGSRAPKAAAAPAAPPPGAAAPWPRPPRPLPRLAAPPPAAFRVDALLSAGQLPDSFPHARIPSGVLTHPKAFQLQGLEWM